MLSSLDAIHISAVLEDCVDQLAILGHIMPPTLEGKPDAAQIVEDELGQILQDQRDLESRYEAVRNSVHEREKSPVPDIIYALNFHNSIHYSIHVLVQVLLCLPLIPYGCYCS